MSNVFKNIRFKHKYSRLDDMKWYFTPGLSDTTEISDHDSLHAILTTILITILITILTKNHSAAGITPLKKSLLIVF